MAQQPTLRFRTPHIEEIPITQTKQAPGFAWVAVAKNADPSKAALEVTSKKRARTGPGQSETQKEALTVSQQQKIDSRIRELNSDNQRAANVVIPKKEGAGGAGGVRAGKTTNTKKILGSGKTFAHYLDDEEAELAHKGTIDGIDRSADAVMQAPPPVQRASKTPIARRIQREQSTASGSPAPSALPPSQGLDLPFEPGGQSEDEDDGVDSVAPLPSEAEMRALLDAPPLVYNAARSAPLPSSAPPSRVFCEICGYWGRVKCLKCGARTCSVDCETVHVADRCLKFYA